ncbi:MAG: type I restriction-modification enzyme R subunit C-terminal domain-containing protein, partial [Oribacterium sp.]|nr:type I restriction-modification enzyme R subunit C-terminal domain-containing protein [Oribacterium sp.]
TIMDHSKFKETTIRTGKTAQKVAEQDMGYGKEDLDRSVITPDQIRKVLTAYRDAIYTDLYPERKADYAYIPKTLIFAKDDRHATKIVEIAKEVFGEKFDGGQVPEHYVQKITYSAGDSDDLIRDFRTERDFRIAVTVTLVATGTDVKPLEVVLFMTDVRSDVLYTQMKGRGCRTIPDDILREVTPNAERKDCFYIVDAVGVTESEKHIPQNTNTYYRRMSLEMLLERLSHGDLSDENLLLLRDYCATIEHRYENSVLFGRHLDEFIEDFGFSPRMIAGKINKAFEEGGLPIFLSPSEDNKVRRTLIDRLVGNLSARKKLLELQRGYVVETDEKDTVTYAGFSKETARSYIEHFEAYINEHRDDIEALRILYNSEDVIITHSMLYDLQEKLLSEDSQYSAFWLWKNYKILDEANAVEELDTKTNVKALTNLMQIVRFAYGKNVKLVSLLNGYTQRFNLYCGQAQRTLTEEQQAIMRRIATYIVEDGSINARELNDALPDLWREGIQAFGNITKLDSEMNTMSRFILKIA